MATRVASELVLDALTVALPEMIGGSADLPGSNNTKPKRLAVLSAAEPAGRFIHYGVREHGMAAAMNGMALHGGIIPYSGTFLTFSDYCRPAIRLAALMGQRVVFVMTHDSIGLGEDGPTHQPVEQLISLRAVPGLVLLRPGDANEVVEAYRTIMQLRHQPAAIVLSRQPLPTFDRSKYASAAGVARGAYVMADAPGGSPEIILIATGSEVCLAIDAHETLLTQGIRSRVVSMPSWDIFEHQPQSYRDSVLPPKVTARIAIEQASALGWDRYVGGAGQVIAMKTFGGSAPLKELQKKFGFQPERIVAAAREMLGRD
jgi:transketolase